MTGADELILLQGATEADRREAPIGGGQLFAYTDRAPDKTTDNEDTVAAIPWGPDACVLVIADGVGGLPGGKRASSLAVAELVRVLEESAGRTLYLRNAVLNGIEAANAAVRGDGWGSATTLTVVTVEGHLARSYQVGDSEALIVGQRGRIRLQTLPHSPTGFAVEAGFLTHRDALHHAERHLVSNFVGTDDMRIDIGPGITLNPKDTILLASDGLTDNLHLDEVIARMRRGPLSSAGASLISLASRRMANGESSMPSKPDDLSLILFRKPFSRQSPASAGEAAAD